MKKHLLTLLGAGALCWLTVSPVAAGPMKGQIDFGAFTPPPDGGEFVEVNIPSNLISLAARFVEKEEPDVAKFLQNIKLVRVNVIGLDDNNREEVGRRVKKVRKDLSSGNGWTRLVTAMDKGQDVGVYINMAENDAVNGLAVVVMEGNKQAVFVNVVGNIQPEQLTSLGERLHIQPLKEIGDKVKEEKTKAEEEPK
jgi:hypothetical protein